MIKVGSLESPNRAHFYMALKGFSCRDVVLTVDGTLPDERGHVNGDLLTIGLT